MTHNISAIGGVCWIKPKSKSAICVQSIKKAMLDVRLEFLNAVSFQKIKIGGESIFIKRAHSRTLLEILCQYLYSNASQVRFKQAVNCVVNSLTEWSIMQHMFTLKLMMIFFFAQPNQGPNSSGSSAGNCVEYWTQWGERNWSSESSKCAPVWTGVS